MRSRVKSDGNFVRHMHPRVHFPGRCCQQIQGNKAALAKLQSAVLALHGCDVYQPRFLQGADVETGGRYGYSDRPGNFGNGHRLCIQHTEDGQALLRGQRMANGHDVLRVLRIG